MRYSDVVLQHFFAPKNVGEIVASEQTGIAQLGSQSNGDVIQFAVKIKAETIIEVKFMAQASCPTIAACSLLSEHILNQTIQFAEKISAQALLAELSLPPTKMHCVLLALDAMAAALCDVKRC